MNRILTYTTIILLLVSAIGCTEDMDLQLKDTAPRLVVDGFVSDQVRTHFVRLTTTESYFNNAVPSAIRNAKVIIKDNGTPVELTESTETAGYYLAPANFVGQAGHLYELTIENVDINNDGNFETYTAQSILNAVAPIDSVGLKYNSIWDLWQVLLYAAEPEETDDFYSFSVAVNDSMLTDRYSKLGFVEDRFFDGNYANGAWVQTISEEDDKVVLKEGDWVKLTMSGITKEFYEFLIAIDIETGFKAPLFSGPPANVPSNVSNGALGFFHAFSTTTDSVQYDPRIHPK